MPSGALLLVLFVLVVGAVYWAEQPNPNDCDPAIIAQLRTRYGPNRYNLDRPDYRVCAQ